MNAATIIVLLLVIVLAGLALWSIIKTKKNGGGCAGCDGCGGGCSQCGTQKGK
ncbi:FeoB-associated Cys-rich membrane protein [Anaerovoracaceae bacterium 42-11]